MNIPDHVLDSLDGGRVHGLDPPLWGEPLVLAVVINNLYNQELINQLMINLNDQCDISNIIFDSFIERVNKKYLKVNSMLTSLSCDLQCLII